MKPGSGVLEANWLECRHVDGRALEAPARPPRLPLIAAHCDMVLITPDWGLRRVIRVGKVIADHARYLGGQIWLLGI